MRSCAEAKDAPAANNAIEKTDSFLLQPTVFHKERIHLSHGIGVMIARATLVKNPCVASLYKCSSPDCRRLYAAIVFLAGGHGNEIIFGAKKYMWAVRLADVAHWRNRPPPRLHATVAIALGAVIIDGLNNTNASG